MEGNSASHVEPTAGHRAGVGAGPIDSAPRAFTGLARRRSARERSLKRRALGSRRFHDKGAVL